MQATQKLVGLLFLALSLSSTSFAGELNDLGMKLDPAKNKAPNLDVKAHEVVGTCDGKDYSSQAEFDGCNRQKAAGVLPTYVGGNQRDPISPKPVPTHE